MVSSRLLFPPFILAAALSVGCASIISVSQSDFKPGATKAIGSLRHGVGYLHFATPRLSVMDDLNSKCANGKGEVTGVQTTLRVRDFIVVQEYELEGLGYCISPEK